MGEGCDVRVESCVGSDAEAEDLADLGLDAFHVRWVGGGRNGLLFSIVVRVFVAQLLVVKLLVCVLGRHEGRNETAHFAEGSVER